MQEPNMYRCRKRAHPVQAGGNCFMLANIHFAGELIWVSPHNLGRHVSGRKRWKNILPEQDIWATTKRESATSTKRFCTSTRTLLQWNTVEGNRIPPYSTRALVYVMSTSNERGCWRVYELWLVRICSKNENYSYEYVVYNHSYS